MGRLMNMMSHNFEAVSLQSCPFLCIMLTSTQRISLGKPSFFWNQNGKLNIKISKLISIIVSGIKFMGILIIFYTLQVCSADLFRKWFYNFITVMFSLQRFIKFPFPNLLIQLFHFSRWTDIELILINNSELLNRHSLSVHYPGDGFTSKAEVYKRKSFSCVGWSIKINHFEEFLSFWRIPHETNETGN